MSFFPISEIVDKAITYVFVHPVQLTLHFKSLDEDFANEIREACEMYKIDPTSITWETVLIPDCKELYLVLDNTNSGDIRGGNCGNLVPHSDFQWTIQTSQGLTLRQLSEGIYRLKGSKYDFYYELFIGVSLTQTDGRYHGCVGFDHGS